MSKSETSRDQSWQGVSVEGDVGWGGGEERGDGKGRRYDPRGCLRCRYDNVKEKMRMTA